MGERRTRSVGTKLTEEEYAKLEALAAQRGVMPGECVRDLVLGAFGESSRPDATPTEQATTDNPNGIGLLEPFPTILQDQIPHIPVRYMRSIVRLQS